MSKEENLEEADILIDDREPKRVGDKISSKGLSVNYKRLGVGDYVWGNTVVERKSLKDFIGSIYSTGKKSPRIWRQAKGMTDNFDNSFIVISGTSLGLSYKKRYKTNMIYGTIAALELGFDIHVNRVENESELVDFIYSLWKRGSKGTTNRSYPSTPASAPLSDRIENTLCQASRVGIKTSQKLLKEIPSLESIVELSEEELQDKIGNSAGSKLYNMLHSEVNYDED